MSNAEEVVFKLSHPYTFKEMEYTEIKLRRAKVSDLRATDSIKGDVERVTKLTSRLSGVPVPALDEMDAADFSKIQEHVAGFLGVSLPTG